MVEAKPKKERISRNEGDDHFAFLDQPAVFRKDGIYRSLISIHTASAGRNGFTIS